jgi:hypothetical protein
MSTTMTLSELRTAVRQRADMVNSTFVSDSELNSYINQSYFELYDLLVTTYEDYYVATPVQVQTDGSTNLIPLPNGTLYSSAPAFYKLIGVDLGVASNTNAWVTLRKFDFISRNRFVYPQLATTALGLTDLRYRVVGNNLMLIPTPSAGQYLQIWYIPRLTTLSADGDTADGISGWTEYIIADAAIKCGQKEETDVTILVGQKMALIKRIEESAMNRDAGQPDTISNTRSISSQWGFGPNGDGGFGGF